MPGLSTDIWEFRATAGLATAGGGFDTASGGTDYSNQDAVQASWTNLSTSGATLTDDGSTGLFTSAMIGNYLQDDNGDFYRVTAFTNSNVVTIDRTPSVPLSGASASLGGALKIITDAFIDDADVLVPGNTIYIKNDGTMTLTGSVSTAKNGTLADMLVIEGYNDSRGDNPIGLDRPLIAAGPNDFRFNDRWWMKNFRLTITTSLGLDLDDESRATNCQVVNSSVTANRNAFDFLSSNTATQCEGESTNGRAFDVGTNTKLLYCYAHDSDIGIYAVSGGDQDIIVGCVIDTCTTAGIDATSNNECLVLSNTIYNCGVGIRFTTGPSCSFINNILKANTTGASFSSEVPSNFWDYNCWDNIADVSNVTKGPNFVDGDPLLTSGVARETDGTTEAGDETDFRSASAPFSGVTTNDKLAIFSGTSVTTGIYDIVSVDSSSQLTISAGATTSASNVVFGVVKGADFTLAAGSPCLDAGMQPGTDIGLTGDYKWNIGVDQDDVAAGGGGVALVNTRRNTLIGR